MANALHTPGVVDSKAARLDDGGLLALQGPGALDVRTGVMVGPGSTALVTGTSSTSPMRYSVAPHHWVTSRSAASGPYRGTLEATQLVDTTAAPGSGSRIDVIWAKQQDNTLGIPSPDGTAAEQYGCTQGTATTGTPTKPAIPVGALELATATVSAGTTSTNGAGVTITNTARQTVARGAPIPVRSQAERDALTQYNGLTVDRLDLGILERHNGTAWKRVGGDITLGDGFYSGTGDLAVAATPGWTDIATVTATSLGGECVARWVCTLANGNSGADRTGSFRVVCDSTQLGTIGPVLLRLSGLQPQTRAGAYSSTPGAGSHTWKLQANGSTGAAVIAHAGLLTVVEK